MQNEETEYLKNPRAGLIPFIREKGEIKYLMMVASNPIFGGPRPMISKGKIEEDEDAYHCAIREAIEELGLVDLNMKTKPFKIAEERVVLRSGMYDFTLYAVELYNTWHFEPWCEETEYTEWHTLESFVQHGRRDHVKFIAMLEERIKHNDIG
jgi:8-oxo-dGTP pyrophosphatase MutT (NUDIX family)